MRIQSSIGLAVGPANSTHWGQVLVLPNAYGILEIEDASGNAQQVGVGILSQTGELLSGEPSSLKAVEDVADKTVRPQVKTLILMVPVGGAVYLVIRGKGAVYIKRGGELASLMHQDGAISGEVKKGDTLLLASVGFSALLSHQELTGLFDHLAPSDVAEKLTLLLHEKTAGEGSVALVFGVSSVEEIQPEKEMLIKDEQDDEEKNQGTPLVNKESVIFKLRKYISAAKRQAVYIRGDRRRFTAYLAAGLMVLFVLSVILGVWKQATAKKNQQVTIALSDAGHALEEGVALMELNPVKGRERLTQAKTLLEPFVHTLSPRSGDGRKVTVLYGQITDNLTQAMQVTKSQMVLFYDVSLLKKGAAASAITREEDVTVIGDQTTSTVYQLNVASKNAQIAGGGDSLRGLSLVGIHGDTTYVLTPEGVIAVRLGDKKASLVIKKDDQWGTIAALVAFGGNVYLLDTQKSRIWKYVATEKGFSETREYLNPDTLPDLSQATGMAIDGSVYIGTNNGKILRFTQGKDNTFMLKGVEPAFGTKLVVYTSDDTKNIYVLDTQNSRIVVLDKEGTYLAQYRFDAAKLPTNFVVFEEQKKMLLLSEGKLYGIDLK